jgi:hypothetical protein
MVRKYVTVVLYIFLVVFSLRVSAVANPLASIYLVWDHSSPEMIKYYQLYISDSQGVFTRPYARISRLPTSKKGYLIRLPVGTKYLVVTSVDENGNESGHSNQLKIEVVINDTNLG